MKYPYVSPSVRVSSLKDDKYLLYNYLTQYSMTLNKEDYEFLMRLDGKTDPYSLSADKEYADDLISYLDSERMIRKSRILVDSWNVFLTIWQVQNTGWLMEYAPILNMCIILLMPVTLFLGFHFGAVDFAAWGHMPIAGMVCGLLCGTFFHEMGHGIATLAYGGSVYEFGIGLTHLLPMAYTFIDVESVPSRVKQVQIMLAGVEMNVNLTGIFLLLSSISSFSSFFMAAAMINLYLACINLVGNVMVDGFDVVMRLLGIRIQGDISLKSLLTTPDIRLKGIHRWAFYICMACVLLTHIMSILVFIGIIWMVYTI